MGISNSIGSNTFDILLCLGLPWLIKASFLPTTEGQHFVGINSRGLEYSAISLLSTLLLLYATFSCNKFQLDRKVGQACLIMYGMFLVLASLIELNVFFMVNLPTCGRWTFLHCKDVLWWHLVTRVNSWISCLNMVINVTYVFSLSNYKQLQNWISWEQKHANFPLKKLLL